MVGLWAAAIKPYRGDRLFKGNSRLDPHTINLLCSESYIIRIKEVFSIIVFFSLGSKPLFRFSTNTFSVICESEGIAVSFMRVGLVARDKFISFYEMSCEMRNKDRMSTQFFEMGRGLYGAIVIWGFLRVPICTKKKQCVLKIKYPPPNQKRCMQG